MSRSNNTDQPNPAIRFYQWNGATGGFHYWDKSKGEKGERMDIALPFRFMPLDCLSTIKGYSDSDQSGYWSNEVRDIKKDVLTVRTKKGQFAKGTYEEIKGRGGMKFCQSVYVAVREGGTLAIANLQLTGAALSAWIEFRKKDKQIYNGVIEVSDMVQGKKGITVYQIPVFKKIESNKEADRQATELDKQLQSYLKGYFNRTQDEVAAIHAAEAVPTDEDNMSDVPDANEYDQTNGTVDELPF